jgi:predicted dehydrogenase
MEAKKDRVVKVCQIGAGLIGRERIKAIGRLIEAGRNLRLCAVYDPYLKEQRGLPQKDQLHRAGSLHEVFAFAPDWVFISTPHDCAAQLAKDALARGHNVLMEKPMGRNRAEAEDIAASQTGENRLAIGFNYRFFAGIHSALTDLKEKAFGDIVSVNLVLGHGGSPEDRASWKLDAEKAGGGVLIDPGIHLLDLCQCMFPGGIQVQKVLTWQGFWKTGIEEEAHVLLQSGKSILNLQFSIVKWRSTFRIEINGDEGYGIVEGRGRSYGRQTYLRGKRWGWRSGGRQRETEEVVVTTDGDDVFCRETEAVLFGNPEELIKPCTSAEALAGMTLLDACRASCTG